MNISIKVEGIRELQQQFDPRAFAKATAGAINRTATYGRAQIVKSMREEYTVQARKVRSDIKIKKANMYNLTASIEVPRNPIALSWFKVKGGGKRRTPAQVQVLKGGAYKPIGGGAFVMSIRGRKIPVRREGRDRVPTKFIMGPSLGGAVAGRLQKPLIDKITIKANEEIKRIKYALGKGKLGQSGDYA